MLARMRLRLPLALLLVAVAWLAIPRARSHPGEVNRCLGSDGRTIFTDQSCDQIGAIIKPQAPDITGSNKSAGTVRVHVRDCAKSLDALRDGVQAALAAGDVNHLAAFYQWTGMGTTGANAVMSRLQAIVERPLIGVTLLQPHPRTEAANAEAPTAAPGTPARASGLVIDQSRAPNDPTPTRTVFGVSAYMGCWWLRF